jgi:hypothetical protein
VALGRFATRRRWWVAAGALLFVLAGGSWGIGVFASLTGGAGFDDPAGESTRADNVLAGSVGRDVADVVVLYSSPT